MAGLLSAGVDALTVAIFLSSATARSDKVESAEIRRLAANEKGRETNLRSGKPVSV
jgi:hypothetical protein